jgi:hypothetical protein
MWDSFPMSSAATTSVEMAKRDTEMGILRHDSQSRFIGEWSGDSVAANAKLLI